MKILSIFFIILLGIIPACSSPAETPSSSVNTAPPVTSLSTTANNDVPVAAITSALLLDMEEVDKYYSDGLSAVAQIQSVTATPVSYSATRDYTIQLAGIINRPWTISPETLQLSVDNVPPEFLQPLPASGGIAAPAGGCPAAAKPTVTFETEGGSTVTPELITNKNLKALPSELLTMDQNSSGSLTSLINSAVQSGDRSLATAQGWDNFLWDKLEALQTTPQSLMDYQLWNASSDLEQQVAVAYRERIQAAGVPAMVMNAFDTSAKSGWFTSTPPRTEDALNRMYIEGVLSGSLNGVVHEQRDFSIPGARNAPVYGVQTGTGNVTWGHPELGLMTFDVEINLDKFDEQGRAIGGTTIARDAEKGYEIRFTFNPDGTKTGEVYKDGENVGLVTMTTNAEKFENYLDLKTNKTVSLPEVKLD